MTTTHHGLNKPAKGAKAWHTDVNANWDDIDERLPRDYAGDPNSNVAGAYIGQLIYDSTNDILYACTTTGDAATAVWETVSPDLSAYLQASDNLASLADAPTALGNLGLTATAAELNQLNGVTLGALASLGTVSTTEIDNDAVTPAKMSTGTANRLLGYDGTGNPSEVSLGTNVTLSGGTLSVSNFLTDVSQGDLNTSSGVISIDIFSTGTPVSGKIGTLPGGQYGFLPENDADSYFSRIIVGIASDKSTNGYVSELHWLSAGGGGSNDVWEIDANFRQRYVTSSPPFDLGDGECGGFIFLKLDKQGEIKQSYIADVPPWGYNGPTDIRADMRDAQGNKYRKIITAQGEQGILNVSDIVKRPVKALQDLTPDELALLLNYDVGEAYQFIDQEIKNRDMTIIPHPFNDEPDTTIVMADTQCHELRKLIHMQNAGADILSLFKAGHYYVDNEEIEGRHNPKGVIQCKLKKKLTKGV